MFDRVVSAGFEPATQRIQAQFQYGYYITPSYGAAVNLAVCGSVPIEVRFSINFWAYNGMRKLPTDFVNAT